MSTKTATLYRMVMDKHVCPYGLRSKHLLESHGYTVEDHHLTTREETDAFKAKHDVKTTPQTFIDGKRIGGNDDLRRFFGKSVADPDATSYKPVYRPKYVTFLNLAFSRGRLVQRVLLQGPDSIAVVALFPMMQMNDGSWRVDGCVLVPATGKSVSTQPDVPLPTPARAPKIAALAD